MSACWPESCKDRSFGFNLWSDVNVLNRIETMDKTCVQSCESKKQQSMELRHNSYPSPKTSRIQNFCWKSSCFSSLGFPRGSQDWISANGCTKIGNTIQQYNTHTYAHILHLAKHSSYFTLCITRSPPLFTRSGSSRLLCISSTETNLNGLKISPRKRR